MGFPRVAKLMEPHDIKILINLWHINLLLLIIFTLDLDLVLDLILNRSLNLSIY